MFKTTTATVKRLFLAATLSSTLILTPGCATVAAVQSVSEVVAAANKPADEFFDTLVDERAYYGLLSFEVTANKLASDAVDFGFVVQGSPTATKVADLLVKLAEVSEAAKQAKALNDAASVSAKVKEGKALYTQILNLVK